MGTVSGYELSRAWFDFAFENPEKISPTHAAVYFFAIEHCNRMGWKHKFGFPSQMAMDAIGVKSYNTYIRVFNDLVDWGFFELVQRSKNQYSSNIIALSKNDKAPNKALDKALTKHTSKHLRSTQQSIDSINKQVNKETNNKETGKTDFKKYLDHYNTYCEKLPTAIKLTEKRTSAINARVTEYDEKTVLDVIERVGKSNFLTGINNNNWKCDFDWILNPNNFLKILEGKYDNPKNNFASNSKPSGAQIPIYKDLD